MAEGEAAAPVMEAVAKVGGSGVVVPMARLFSLARSALAGAMRVVSRKCFSFVVLLGVPTTVLAFLLARLNAMQAARRKALAEKQFRRRQEAQTNIAAGSAELQDSANSGTHADVLSLGFLELQERLKDGKITAHAVLGAYRMQAGRAHARVNCLTEFLPNALPVAQACFVPSRNADSPRTPLLRPYCLHVAS